jgi:transcriptional regulator with XRE-family HTH domain
MSRTEASLEWATYGLSFGERLKHLRLKRNLSQENLAELCGMHRNQISNLERATNRPGASIDPHLSTVFRLAQALKVAPLALIPDGENIPLRTSRESRSDMSFRQMRASLDEQYP